MAEIVPGILEKDFQQIADKVALAAPHVPWIHIDFADETMVPVATPWDFDAYTRLIGDNPDVSFEAHLLVANPEKHLKQLTDAGFKRLFFHIESNDPRRFLEAARYEEIEVAAAIDGTTGVDDLEPFLEEVDSVLIAAIEEGKSGQAFMPESLEKIKLIRQNFVDLPITVVGGINEETARLAVEAGATRLISTSYIFKNPNGVEEAIATLKGV